MSYTDNDAMGMHDMIYFAIRATRSEGDEKITALRNLKSLIEKELNIEHEKISKSETISISRR